MRDPCLSAPPHNPDWPKFNAASPNIHDWRNYVGERMQKVWPTLTLEQQCAIALDMQERADMEGWD